MMLVHIVSILLLLDEGGCGAGAQLAVSSGWREPLDCVRASELCNQNSQCSSRFRIMRQCLSGGDKERSTMLASKECQGALEVLQDSPLYDCRCKRGMKKELQCLQNYWSIHMGLSEECIFQMTQELRLDPLVGYCAIEILERFMVKHLKDMFTANNPCGAVAGLPSNYQDLVFEKLKVKFTLTVFSCVQIASKLWLHGDIVDNNQAVQFLHSMGHTVSKKALMESELQILKGLDFKLNVPNPLTYVEILLEVLGHNEPSTPMEQLYGLCGHVLRFVCLQRTAVYESLLKITTQCISPSQEQREKFLTVTEDCMLLGVGVITVAAVIWNGNKWEQVVEDLSHITGISQRSIWDFSQVTLEQITKNSSPVLST